MFSWLNTKNQEYPDTLDLKLYASVPKVNMRPHFEPECTDHPLSWNITTASFLNSGGNHVGMTDKSGVKLSKRQLRERSAGGFSA